MSDRGFLATATTGLSVTDATGRVALAAKGAVALVQNRGASWVYFKFGDATVVATTSDTPLGPGAGIAMDQGTFTHIAAICDSTETSTIKITTGGGQVALTQSAEVAISGVTVTTDTEATATASAPSYSEGTQNNMSMNLVGALRTLSQGTCTAAAPTYTNATTNPLSLNTTGDVRVVFSNTSIAVGSALPAGTNAIGDTGTAPRAAQLSSATVNSAAGGDITLVAAASAKTTKLYRIFVTVAGDTTLTFKDDATALTGAMTLKAGGSLVLDFDGEPWFTGSTNKDFYLNSSAAVQVSGRAYYIQS